MPSAVDGDRRSSIASRYRSHPSTWATWSLTDQPSPGVVNASLPQPASVPSRVAHAQLVRSVKSAFIGVAAKASVACSVTLVPLWARSASLVSCNVRCRCCPASQSVLAALGMTGINVAIGNVRDKLSEPGLFTAASHVQAHPQEFSGMAEG